METYYRNFRYFSRLLIMTQRIKKVTSQRLSRDEWIEKALDVLMTEGGSVLTIDNLVKELGVSRGSFYWHFKDRTDFVRHLVDYWLEIFTKEVTVEISELKETAEKRLLSLATHIVSDRLTRYDIAIRAWAAYDPVATRGVKKVDEFRLNYVRSLFSQLGFEGEQLEMRTQTFVVYYSLETSLIVRLTRKQQLKQIKLRHTLLIKP